MDMAFFVSYFVFVAIAVIQAVSLTKIKKALEASEKERNALRSKYSTLIDIDGEAVRLRAETEQMRSDY